MNSELLGTWFEARRVYLEGRERVLSEIEKAILEVFPNAEGVIPYMGCMTVEADLSAALAAAGDEGADEGPAAGDDVMLSVSTESRGDYGGFVVSVSYDFSEDFTTFDPDLRAALWRAKEFLATAE